MATEKCVNECLTILRLMKGDPWEPAHAGFYGVTLQSWPDEVARKVVNHCANTLTFRPSRAELLAALHSSDGRPGPEEAWGMIPKSEMETVVWTSEMALASAAAQPLLDAGDKVGARMAFKEKYAALVAEARSAGTPVAWTVSLGEDKAGREAALGEGYRRGIVSKRTVEYFLDPTAAGRVLDAGKPSIAAIEGERCPVTIKELAARKALK